MKRIIFLFLPFLPYLASAQVAKDTVTVLTLAQIPAGAIRDTTNLTFVQDNGFKKATFDSLAKYTRVKLQTYTLDSTHITASGLNLQGTRFTGVLPVTRGGTGNTTGLAATATALATARTIQTNLASTSAASFDGTANITPGVTGQLPVSSGGTGQNSLEATRLLVGNGTSGVLAPSFLTWDNSNRRLGIGITSPRLALDVIGNAIGLTGGTNSFVLFAGGVYSSTVSHATYFQSSRARGTEASPQAVQDGDLTFSLAAQPYNGTTFVQNAGIFFEVDGALNGTNIPSRIRFNTHSTTGYFERMRLIASGDLLVGHLTDQSADLLQVNGSVRATAFNTFSDRKLKENIEPLESTLDIVNSLTPVTFNFTTDSNYNFGIYPEVGFIAQDVDRVLSSKIYARSIVKPSDDSDPESILSFSMNNLIPLLTKAIQEQQQQIEQLKQRITQLENK